MELDARLEALSDKIRAGEPVGIVDAIRVIDYQERLQAHRQAQWSKTLIGRFVNWIRATPPNKETP